ncbi:hypothetical protein [Streptomyces sp. CB01881]|uniref:hypothetical protein n=1 Tax=Streptomyces sp. CB01881 TaxID=2078691 RepID=UPI000CDC67D3|nr:hypothetical protein [Streptomyces sp. CB01881]AUY51223.1 hypothetical protein C2142_22335 [Streptomyces sp. CB01881]TYC74610.1 hypothetical protein EH183_22310 [Streptomyces sp. CB01881]
MITGAGSLEERVARLRRERGLLTPAELMDLADEGVVVLDPFSVIVSRRVRLHPENVLYPGVVIECDEHSGCLVRRGNVLHGGTLITATGGGTVVIGARSEIGEGGARIRAAGTDAIDIGDGTRLAGGAEVTGTSRIGSGAQVLGQVSARSVTLAAGHPYTYPDPDGRGAVLKGFGRALGIRLGVGEVVNGSGDFRDAPVERQRIYHPEAPHLA